MCVKGMLRCEYWEYTDSLLREALSVKNGQLAVIYLWGIKHQKLKNNHRYVENRARGCRLRREYGEGCTAACANVRGDGDSALSFMARRNSLGEDEGRSLQADNYFPEIVPETAAERPSEDHYYSIIRLKIRNELDGCSGVVGHGGGPGGRGLPVQGRL